MDRHAAWRTVVLAALIGLTPVVVAAVQQPPKPVVSGTVHVTMTIARAHLSTSLTAMLLPCVESSGVRDRLLVRMRLPKGVGMAMLHPATTLVNGQSQAPSAVQNVPDDPNSCVLVFDPNTITLFPTATNGSPALSLDMEFGGGHLLTATGSLWTIGDMMSMPRISLQTGIQAN